MATTEVGALIISLRTESAAFRAEMDNARKSIRGAGEQAGVSSRQIAKLAADGFGAVLPISFQAENAIERFIEKSLKAQGALGLLAKSTLAVGAGLAAFKLGEKIGEFAALGTSVAKYEENIKKAAGEQKGFSDAMGRSRDIMRGLAKELATLRGDQAAAVEATLKDAEAQIIKSLGGASPQAKAALELLGKIRIEQNRKVLDEQRKAREEREQGILDEMNRQVEAWQKETQALIEQLKLRTQARQNFEAQFGQGGLPGPSATQGLRAVRDLKAQIDKELLDLAGAERLGRITPRDADAERENVRRRALEEARRLKGEFAEFPAVLDAVDSGIAGLEFGNLGKEMAAARAEAAKLLDTDRQLAEGLGAIAVKLIETLPATEAAAEANRALTAAYLDAANAVYQFRVQLAALASEEAATQ